MHYYWSCFDAGCCSLSYNKKARISQMKKQDMFQHKWLSEQKYSFDIPTKSWWSVYIEGEGIYCIWCRKHSMKTSDNIFAQQPSIQYKTGAMTTHKTSISHRAAANVELVQRGSVFQKQVDNQTVQKKMSLEMFLKVFTGWQRRILPIPKFHLCWNI